MNKANTELRVRGPFKTPIDPMNVMTMADYDLSLILFRNWFGFDDSGKVRSDLISEWRFSESLGGYEFTIASDTKYSNGVPVTPPDLQLNLERAMKTGSSYANGISELIDVQSFQTVSPSTFTIKTKDGKRTDTFFKRMGSIFWAVVPPADLSADGISVMSNTLSLGAYKLVEVCADELKFERNEYFLLPNLKAPKSITVRKPDSAFAVVDFLDGKSWENYVQLSTLIPQAASEKLSTRNLPFWTRTTDRVSILKPLGTHAQLELRRTIVKAIASAYEKTALPEFKMNVKRARGLQPTGYPLFQEIDFSEGDVSILKGMKISILAQANDLGKFHRKILEEILANAGAELDWRSVNAADFYQELAMNSNCDLALVNFGVADPEATTWAGFLFGNHNLISFDDVDRDEFFKLSSRANSSALIHDYKELLARVALKGGYLPLFHFSTLAIGQKGMSFNLVGNLDETVNYAKIVFEDS